MEVNMYIKRFNLNYKVMLSTILPVFIVLTLLVSMSPITVSAEINESAVYDHFYTYKFSSKHSLGPSQSLTYTILLYNSSTETVSADVVDILPEELSFMAGSASDGGIYDQEDHTISWTGLELGFASQKMLTFDVMAPAVIGAETEVVNSATVVASSNPEPYHIESSVLLLPLIPRHDVEFPVVNSVVIDEVDALTTRDVTLHITASDNTEVTQMMIEEYQLVEKPNSANDWEMTESSEWVPYQEEYEYTLGDNPGVHFIGVWVQDGAGNVSHATQESFDFASYLQPETVIANKITNVPYAVYYDQGVDVQAELEQLSGEPGICLYVWFAGNFGTADITCGQPAEFTTPTAGVYLFVVGVQAPQEVSYSLSITPGGGPSAWGSLPPRTMNQMENIVSLESIFDEVGLDPISMALANQPVVPNVPAEGMILTHLPLIWR